MVQQQISTQLSIIFNESLATGVLSAEFKTGNIIPILKPGKRDSSAPSSYCGMGRIHKVSRQIACGANRLARFSTRIHFVRWSSTSKVWRTFVEGKKGNYALPSLLGLPWCFTRRIHVNLSWSPQEQRIFDEHFTD